MPRKKKINLKAVADDSLYLVIVTIAGTKYEALESSISEAFSKMNLTWQEIKYKGLVKIVHEGKTCEHLFFPKQLKLIFNNKLTRSVWSSKLERLLK